MMKDNFSQGQQNIIGYAIRQWHINRNFTEDERNRVFTTLDKKLTAVDRQYFTSLFFEWKERTKGNELALTKEEEETLKKHVMSVVEKYEERCLGCKTPGQFPGFFCAGCLGNNNPRSTTMLMETRKGK